MTQIFGDDGQVQPVTVLDVAPMVISQVKTKDKDGYEATQIGIVSGTSKNLSKPIKGHLKDLEIVRHIKEFRTDNASGQRGEKIQLDSLQVGDIVNVSAISKGKGFQGVVKRHGFHGGPRSHGQKHSEREPGSIGGGGRDGGRVAKGKRMAGRMGSDRVTIKNLKIVALDKESNTLLISGAVPGKKGTVLEIRSVK